MSQYKYVSFYISKDEINNLNRVKEFCRRHGISFSELMRNVLQAIAVSVTNIQVNINQTNININAPINIQVIQKQEDTKDEAIKMLEQLITAIKRTLTIVGQKLSKATLQYEREQAYRWGYQQIGAILRDVEKKLPKLLLKK